MWLTKNEKRVLKLLLENAKISDSTIASILKISSQAVGKIKKKLERTVIDSYTVNLNFERLGIHTFAVGLVNISDPKKDPLFVEQKLLEDTHVISVYRLPCKNPNYIILYGFRDTNELDSFFHSKKKREELHSLIHNRELHVFSHSSLLKNNPLRLFSKAIDNFESGFSKKGFREDNTFKSWK